MKLANYFRKYYRCFYDYRRNWQRYGWTKIQMTDEYWTGQNLKSDINTNLEKFDKKVTVKRLPVWSYNQCKIMNLLNFKFWFCDCEYVAPYGRVILADCKKHD